MSDTLSHELRPRNDAEQLCFSSVAELRSLLDTGQVSSRELTRAHLDRIERLNPQLNAYITVLDEYAMAAAHEADSRQQAGATRGPLDGIPVSVKDVEPMAGVAYTLGLKARATTKAEEDALHTRRLKAAGAVILGKTNTPEMGHKATTDNQLIGPAINPWNTAYNAGGSSGGAAAAVAAGMAVVSQGSDGGGSIRIPAAMCGVVGMKASAGAIPDEIRPDAFAAATPFLHIGPIARSVADTAVLFGLLAQPSSRDPLSAPLPTADPGRVDDVRVGFDLTFGNFPVADDIAKITTDAAERLSRRWEVSPVHTQLADHDELAQLWFREIAVLYAFNAEVLAADGRDLLSDLGDTIPPELTTLIERGRSMTALDYRRDNKLRTRAFDAVEDVLSDYDVLVTACVGVTGVPNGEFGRTVGPAAVGGRPVDPTIGWCLTYPVNFSGHPALSIPIGIAPEGLPVGLQIIGRRWEDLKLLEIAQHVERLIDAPSADQRVLEPSQ